MNDPAPIKLQSPEIDPRILEAQRLAELRRNHLQGAVSGAMAHNPYPNNRQGRRRWARELAKVTTGRMPAQ